MHLDQIVNIQCTDTDKINKGRIVRMHSDDMEDIDEAAGLVYPIWSTSMPSGGTVCEARNRASRLGRLRCMARISLQNVSKLANCPS